MPNYYLDITPQVIGFNGQLTELGTVRYDVDSSLLQSNEPIPPTAFFAPIPIDHRAWTKIGFKIELKSADVPQPTKLEGDKWIDKQGNVLDGEGNRIHPSY